LLRSDGRAVACGDNFHGQCDVPAADPGTTHCQVAAGGNHTIMVQSDGRARAFGDNTCGQCDLPDAGASGLTVAQVAAGRSHSVVLRSDGSAVVCGSGEQGQCDVPPLEDGLTYMRTTSARDLVVQLAMEGGDAPLSAVCRSLAGAELAAFRIEETDLESRAFCRVMQEVGRTECRLRVVLGDGRLLSPAHRFADLSMVAVR